MLDDLALDRKKSEKRADGLRERMPEPTEPEEKESSATESDRSTD